MMNAMSPALSLSAASSRDKPRISWAQAEKFSSRKQRKMKRKDLLPDRS
jgi:hypothetical protein